MSPCTDLPAVTAPLDVYETWPKPNYIDPVTEGPALVIIGIVLSGIATLLVAARIYSRLFITQAPGIDDILILISLVSQQLTVITEGGAEVITQASAITLTVLVIICNEKYVVLTLRTPYTGDGYGARHSGVDVVLGPGMAQGVTLGTCHPANSLETGGTCGFRNGTPKTARLVPFSAPINAYLP